MGTRQRSPNYPVIDLEKALDRARQIYDRAKGHPTSIGTVMKWWSYRLGSSMGDQVAAALRSFGLIEVTGTGDNRQMRVTDSARRILLGADDAPELLKKCAATPTINSEILERATKDGLPPRETIKHYLLFDRLELKFSEDTVDSVIERFMDTIRFAKLDSSGIIEEEEAETAVVLADETGMEPISQIEAATRIASLTPGQTTTFPLDEGMATLTWPGKISKESFKDLQAWLKVAMGRIARSVGAENPPNGEET